MYRLTIPARAYAAACHATSTEESRPILNGVNITVQDGCAVLCGTNGHALVMARTHSPYPEDGTECVALPDAGFILPPVKLSAIGVTAKGLDTDLVTLESADGSAWTVSATIAGRYGFNSPSGKLAQVRTIEGPFPNVRAVIPRFDAESKPMPAVAFDTDVLDKAAKYFGKVSLSFTGEERAIVVRPLDTDHQNMVGLIMPLRTVNASPNTPEWVHAVPATV